MAKTITTTALATHNPILSETAEQRTGFHVETVDLTVTIELEQYAIDLISADVVTKQSQELGMPSQLLRQCTKFAIRQPLDERKFIDLVQLVGGENVPTAVCGLAQKTVTFDGLGQLENHERHAACSVDQPVDGGSWNV